MVNCVPTLIIRPDLINTIGINSVNLKIDIDGLEYDVLCGSEKIMEHKNTNSILVEINKDKNQGKSHNDNNHQEAFYCVITMNILQ